MDHFAKDYIQDRREKIRVRGLLCGKTRAGVNIKRMRGENYAGSSIIVFFFEIHILDPGKNSASGGNPPFSFRPPLIRLDYMQATSTIYA